MFNGSVFYGDIVANKIILEQTVIVHYNVALQSKAPPGEEDGGPPKFISWTKPDWKIK